MHRLVRDYRIISQTHAPEPCERASPNPKPRASFQHKSHSQMQAPGVSVPPRLHTDVNVQHNFDSMCTEHALYALQLQFHHHLMPHSFQRAGQAQTIPPRCAHQTMCYPLVSMRSPICIQLAAGLPPQASLGANLRELARGGSHATLISHYARNHISFG